MEAVWLLVGIGFIIYKLQSEEHIFTLQTVGICVGWLAWAFGPYLICLAIFGDSVAEIVSMVTFGIPLGIITFYGLFSSIYDEYKTRKRHEEFARETEKDRKRQLDLERMLPNELWELIGVPVDAIPEDLPTEKQYAVALILKKEGLKYTRTVYTKKGIIYDENNLIKSVAGEKLVAFVDQYIKDRTVYSDFDVQGLKELPSENNGTAVVQATKVPIGRRIVELELLYKTNLPEFERLLGRKVDNVDPPFSYMNGEDLYNDSRAQSQYAIALYDILLSEGYGFSEIDRRGMNWAKRVFSRVKELATMPRKQFETVCGGPGAAIDDKNALHRRDLIKLVLEKEGWDSNKLLNESDVRWVGSFHTYFSYKSEDDKIEYVCLGSPVGISHLESFINIATPYDAYTPERNPEIVRLLTSYDVEGVC